VFPGVVADIADRDGPVVNIRLDCGGEALIARLTRYSVERLGLEPGKPVFALIKSVALDRRSLSSPLPAASDSDAEAGVP
jgi:molybdate transport system ATP-binding protein